VNKDVVGVEIGAALKNVIALATGISDGLSFGDNTKAALITRGINEISRLGIALGANRETFFGLTGIGDLIVTCTSMHSRNRKAGILIGRGVDIELAIKDIGMVAEGINTAKSAKKLALKHGVNTPIISEVYDILFKQKKPKQAVMNLMLRDKTFEYIEF
jgi:glycerol-3-phosphate dehydrogenase (NAD(P)+)